MPAGEVGMVGGGAMGKLSSSMEVGGPWEHIGAGSMGAIFHMVSHFLYSPSTSKVAESFMDHPKRWRRKKDLF